MRGLYAIYRKEMSHYFVSPVAYIIIFIFLGVSGYLFTGSLADAMRNSLLAMEQGTNFDASSYALGNYLGILGFLVLFLSPILAMGVFSEEQKRGTMELLLTSPVTELQIVLGKFFASVSLLVIMLLPTIFNVIFIFEHSEPTPPWRLIAGGYLGVLLLGASLLAIGSFLSSLTENQIISAVSIFGVSLLLWLIGVFAGSDSGATQQVLHYLSILEHYAPFVRGVIDTTSLVFFGSWIFLGIFLTMRAVESMRWRRA